MLDLLVVLQLPATYLRDVGTRQLDAAVARLVHGSEVLDVANVLWQGREVGGALFVDRVQRFFAQHQFSVLLGGLLLKLGLEVGQNEIGFLLLSSIKIADSLFKTVELLDLECLGLVRQAVILAVAVCALASEKVDRIEQEVSWVLHSFPLVSQVREVGVKCNKFFLVSILFQEITCFLLGHLI